ncbi:hypothetical protein [Micropruina glycogenica]|uniref:Uncharacterized protein n=1 Tax=Micropruina glycogenica TaxID=75385 RepID=A0A2N9JJ34_9ACTN|nr:conserved exported protein of unknown function [Micropruina glycogenica]
MRPNWPRVLLVLAVVPVVCGLVWGALALWSGATKTPQPLDDQCKAGANGASVTVTLEQAHNAAIISAVGLRRGLPARAVTIALTTAYQESGIRNLDYGHADSIGLFQQRPSKGWGTIKQIMDPYYSSGKFYDALLGVKNWRTDDINDVAQKVQRSAHPDAYRKHVSKAQALAAALTGVQPGGLTCKAGSPAKADAAGLTALMRKALAGEVKVTRTEKGLIVQGSTQQRAWAAAAFAVAYSDAYGVARVTLGGADWALDTSSLAPWTGNGTGSIVTVSFGT